MPNHCYNILTLLPQSGDTQTLTQAISPYLTHETNGKYFLDFEKIYPAPPGIQKTVDENPSTPELSKETLREENLKLYGSEDWYGWRCKNWGTKWNSYNCHVGEDHIAFDTAWSPPTEVIRQLAIKEKLQLSLEYMETGCDFIGQTYFDPSGIAHDECYTLAEAPQELKNNLGYSEPEDEDQYNEDDEDFDISDFDISNNQTHTTKP